MKRNAFFQLVQKQDGVYLKSYPALEGGAPLSVDDILYYLEQTQLNALTRGVCVLHKDSSHLRGSLLMKS